MKPLAKPTPRRRQQAARVVLDTLSEDERRALLDEVWPPRDGTDAADELRDPDWPPRDASEEGEQVKSPSLLSPRRATLASLFGEGPTWRSRRGSALNAGWHERRGAAFCAACGASFTGLVSTPSTSARGESKWGELLVVIAVIGIVLVGMLALGPSITRRVVALTAVHSPTLPSGLTPLAAPSPIAWIVANDTEPWSVDIPSGSYATYDLRLTLYPPDTVKASVSIAGTGNDIGVSVADPDGVTVFRSDHVTDGYQFSFHVSISGSYLMRLDNSDPPRTPRAVTLRFIA